MIVHLDKLPEYGSKEFSGEIAPELLDLADDKDVKLLSGLKYDLKIQKLDTEVLVRGCISLDVEVQCVRCNCTFVETVEIPKFCKSFEIKDGKNEELDLTFELREDIILAFSLYPLCSEECKGVCTICGKNLNSDECNCSRESENRWSELDNLDI
ncbi:MAG: YceD family protein [Kiritimatiellae bacterium]|jgi:uncharacterized protein|nr:YceD family protein [Kiritimatiellia bacterium]